MDTSSHAAAVYRAERDFETNLHNRYNKGGEMYLEPTKVNIDLMVKKLGCDSAKQFCESFLVDGQLNLPLIRTINSHLGSLIQYNPEWSVAIEKYYCAGIIES
jgi:hypothetical protein